MDKYNCWYQSIENPENKYDIREIIYRCPKTGSLLEVEHDLDLLREKKPEEWKNLLSWVGGAGVEPAQHMRRSYSPLSSPMLSPPNHNVQSLPLVRQGNHLKCLLLLLFVTHQELYLLLL